MLFAKKCQNNFKVTSQTLSQSADVLVAPSTGRLVVIRMWGCEERTALTSLTLGFFSFWNGENQKKSLFVSYLLFYTFSKLFRQAIWLDHFVCSLIQIHSMTIFSNIHEISKIISLLKGCLTFLSSKMVDVWTYLLKIVENLSKIWRKDIFSYICQSLQYVYRWIYLWMCRHLFLLYSIRLYGFIFVYIGLPPLQ